MSDPHPTGRLPGNATAIESEVRRLDVLRDRLWSTGELLHRLSVPGWAGRACDAFDDFRRAMAHRWLMAGDRHDDAARALERYHLTLVDLRTRIATADPADTGAGDLARLGSQLDAVAAEAATAIRRAAEDLATLPHLPDRPPEPATGSAITSAVHDPGLDPRSAHTDSARFHERVRVLTAQLLLATFVPMAPDHDHGRH